MLRQVFAYASRKVAWTVQTPGYRRCRQGGLLLGLAGGISAACGLQVAAEPLLSAQVFADAADSSKGLPTDKLACHINAAAPRRPTVLVACGSFNPPTIMHLRMFDLATTALAQRGFDVWGCYMSPVADAYGKKGLAPVHHRLEMCRLAAADTSNVMVDAWEASQPGYTRTLQVLRQVSHALQSYMQQSIDLSESSRAHATGLAVAATQGALKVASHPSSSSSSAGGSSGGSGTKEQAGTSAADQGGSTAAAAAAVPRVMLLCGADLLASIAEPGVWKDPDIILRDHGIVCIYREGTDVQQLLDKPGTVLHEYRDNIILVEEPVPNHVSSTRIRQLLGTEQPVRYLVPDSVIAYIKTHQLYE